MPYTTMNKRFIIYRLITPFICLFLMSLGTLVHAQNNKNDETRSWDWAFENGEITVYWTGVDIQTKNEYFDCIEEWHGYTHDGYSKPQEYSSYNKAYEHLWKLIYEAKKNENYRKERIFHALIEHNKHKRYRIIKATCHLKSESP